MITNVIIINTSCACTQDANRRLVSWLVHSVHSENCYFHSNFASSIHIPSFYDSEVILMLIAPWHLHMHTIDLGMR